MKTKAQGGRPAKITPDCIEFAISELSKLTLKSELKRLLKEKYDLSPRSCETVFARAREEQIRRVGVPLDQIRGSLANYLLEVMAEKTEPVLARLRAAEQYAKLYGANRPERIEVSGPDGGAIQTEQKAFDPKNCTPEQLATLRAVLTSRQKP